MPRPRSKADALAALLLLAALPAGVPLAAQEFQIFPSASASDSPATEVNGSQEQWLVLGHHNGRLSMRLADWTPAGPTTGVIRTLDDAFASSYAVAYNWESGDFLAAWITYSGGHQVRAARVDSDGVRIGAPTTLYTWPSDLGRVDVIPQFERNRWLVTWSDGSKMQLVRADGSLDGGVFEVGGGGESIDYSPHDTQFLKVWDYYSNPVPSVTARFFRDTGQIVGDLPITNSGWNPAVEYSYQTQRWMVVWNSTNSYGDNSVEGRLVIGGAAQPVLVIGNTSGFLENVQPSVGYSPKQLGFLVAWPDTSCSFIGCNISRLLGQWVDSNGQIVRGPINVHDSYFSVSNDEFLGCGAWRCLVTWREDDEIWGRFIHPGRWLWVHRTGSGTGSVSSSPPGILCGDFPLPDDCSETYLWGSVVELSANHSLDSDFVGWEGGADCLDGIVTLNWDTSCTARFDLGPELTVVKAGSGSGTVWSDDGEIDCGSDCQSWYSTGTIVRLNASADSGSVFSGWGGDADCLDGVVTMSSARSCVANFMQLWTLTVTKAGAGSGTVTSSPGGIACGSDCVEAYPGGTVVRLAPTPDMGSEFAGWLGDTDCEDGLVTMWNDVACTAVFEPCSIPSEVTVSNLVIDVPMTFEACNVLTVGPSVVINGAGDGVFKAGNRIEFIEPVSVDAGCTMTVALHP